MRAEEGEGARERGWGWSSLFHVAGKRGYVTAFEGRSQLGRWTVRDMVK